MKKDEKLPVDELVWKTFEKSGNAGYYLLYKAIKGESQD